MAAFAIGFAIGLPVFWITLNATGKPGCALVAGPLVALLLALIWNFLIWLGANY